MAASIGVLDDLTVALSLWMNREEEKDEACETTTVAWLVGAAALAAQERRNQGCFLKLWALPRCCSRMSFFHRSLWIPLRWGTGSTRRYVDLTGYLQLKSGFRSKMLPTAILSPFLHKPMVGPHCRAGFPRGVVPRRFLGFSLYWSTGKFKKKILSLLELTTLFRFRLYKRKIGLLIQNDPRRKSKKWPKDVVYVSSHFCLWGGWWWRH